MKQTVSFLLPVYAPAEEGDLKNKQKKIPKDEIVLGDLLNIN